MTKTLALSALVLHALLGNVCLMQRAFAAEPPAPHDMHAGMAHSTPVERSDRGEPCGACFSDPVPSEVRTVPSEPDVACHEPAFHAWSFAAIERAPDDARGPDPRPPIPRETVVLRE